MTDENRVRWSFWRGVLPWLLWGLAFFALEANGLRVKRDAFPPLTYVVRRWVPGWLLFAGIGWLAWHFTVTYLGH
jgi:hypothetical protein